MKQVAQNNKTGAVDVLDVPVPVVRAGFVLVRTKYSVISAGTERASVTSRQSSLLDRARKNPDLVRAVLDQVRQYGLLATARRVRGKLDSWSALGYSASGTVVAVGAGVDGIRPGDDIACAGAGYASHAEFLLLPKNLCAKIPHGVPLDEAAYATIGSIALQGVRQANPTLGETVVVIGLGLVGQITVQILKADGCRAVGVDLDAAAVRHAMQSGADAAYHRQSDDVVKYVRTLTGGLGADAVIITAATKSNDPVQLAGELCRDHGRVVLVGDVGLQLPRGPYYMKELDFRLSRSYGPGRYDPAYEEAGNDYPAGYVRWTENRNMQEFLRLLRSGLVSMKTVTTHRFPLEEARDAYAMISGKSKGRKERYVGVLLEYSDSAEGEKKAEKKIVRPAASRRSSPLEIGFIGAGSFAQGTLLPPLRSYPGVRLRTVCTANGLSASNVKRSFRFSNATSDAGDVFGDPEIGTVFIGTRHNLHAPFVEQALNAGKNVFVEKPLALNDQELEKILEAQKRSGKTVMVGFNRRFAPLVLRMQSFFAAAPGSRVMVYRVNAGSLPASHWTRDPVEGGGRIIGEVCHFIDLLQAVCGSAPVSVDAVATAPNGGFTTDDDSVIVSVRFEGGSVGTVVYAATGDASMPKERLEVFSSGRSAVLDNFRTLTMHQGGTVRKVQETSVDKGHRAEVARFLESVEKGGDAPIPFSEIVASTRATFRAMDSLRLGAPVKV